MRLCTDCLHLDDRKPKHCPSCGGSEFARTTRKGDVTAMPGAAGMPCQGCFATGRGLKLRYYRRVTAMLFVDHMHATAGYFCVGCRWKQFGKHFALTMLLGWWGIIAFWFRNPFAILTNIWALFAPPFGAPRLHSLNVDDMRADAAESRRQAQRAQERTDANVTMPSWFEALDEDETSAILTDRDLYADLGLECSATPAEVKAAYRRQVKRHHPDTAATDGHERMVHINGAYRVLSDVRLRHAYDHVDELVAWLEDVRGVEVDLDHEDNDMAGFDWGCRTCLAAFTRYADVYEHVVAEHPDEDPIEVIAELDDGVETGIKTIYVCRLCGSRELMLHEFIAHLNDEHPGVDRDDAIDFEYIDLTAEDDTGSTAATWRCKTCEQVFGSYGAAVSHADNAHPERVAVDVRAAVEAV